MKAKGVSDLPRPHERQAALIAEQQRKMARSAHAYVRGATARFYEWLADASPGLPQGPSIWICGDCHLGNLGPLADANGRVFMQIRDLDQAVIGNPAHDLIRLALSLASAARGSDLPGVTTAYIVEHLMDGYEGALGPAGGAAAAGSDDDKWMDAPEPVVAVVHKALRRRWHHLAEERLDHIRPRIPLGPRFWPLSSEERHEIARLVRTENLRRLVTHLRSRPDNASVDLADAAYWVKGCSSLGRLRFALLLRVGKRREQEYCLVDIKEAAHAAAPRAQDVPADHLPADSAERVVMGARALSPALGNRMIAAEMLGRSVVVRELMPQDLKLEVDRLSRVQACKAARYLGNVVGIAHGRQMSGQDRRHWREQLRSQRSDELEAPFWLWDSVVELLATHEKAYLQHCRRLAHRPA